MRLLIKVKLHKLLTGGAALAEAGGQERRVLEDRHWKPPHPGEL